MNNVSHMPPRLVVSAPQGRSGKTVISIGLCAAFSRRGMVVQPFKKGPDYIDPSWLSAASGRACYNLDSVLMPESAVLASFRQACRGADCAIIEGAMGLYDGIDEKGNGSTAQVARLLNSPVVLVVNAARMTTSAAAMVSGYQGFEPDTDIAGVILNNVSGSRHEHKLVSAIEQHCGIPVVGSVPRDSRFNIAERHLGLIPYGEDDQSAVIDRIGDCIEKHLNMDDILDIARKDERAHVADTHTAQAMAPTVRLGVIRDNVFSFYYPDNLEALRRAGAELVFISSIRDRELPDIDGLYIGGGFPELFLPELEASIQLRHSIAQAIENGMPVYAECAGLMYLCRSIAWHGKQFEMVGVFPADVELCPRPQGHGYVLVEVSGKNPFLPAGLSFWGHEFHHSKLSWSGELEFAYSVKRGHGVDGTHDGIIYKNTLASFTHLHALGVPQWAEAFVCLAIHERKQPLSMTRVYM